MTRPDPVPGLRDGLVAGIDPFERRRVRLRALAGVGLVAVAVGIGALIMNDGDESTFDAVTDGDDETVPDDDTVPDTDDTAPDVPATDDSVPDVDGRWPPVPAGIEPCGPTSVAHDAGLFTNRGGPSWIGVIVRNIGPAACSFQVDQVNWDGRSPEGDPASTQLDYSPTEPGDEDAVDSILEVGEFAAVRLPFARDAGGETLSLSLRTVDGLEVDIFNGLQDAPAVTSATGLHALRAAPGDIVSGVFVPTDAVAGSVLEAGQTISTVGLGAIRAGDTLQEVADATGTPVWAFEWNVASPQCGHAQLGSVAWRDVILHVLGDSLLLDDAIVTAVVITTADYVTPSGIRVGDPESKVLDLLDADRLTRIPSEYTDGHTWKFTPENPDEAHLGVAFSIEDGQVVSIGGGLNDDVYRLEGCA